MLEIFEWTLLANRLKLVCFNFLFAYFTQLFFIRPAVRVIFKTVFRKDIEARVKESEESMAQKAGKYIRMIRVPVGAGRSINNVMEDD